MPLSFLIFLAFAVFRGEASLIHTEDFDGTEFRLSTGKDNEENSDNVLIKSNTHAFANLKYVERIYLKYGKLYRLGLQLENMLKRKSVQGLNAPTRQKVN